MMWVRPSEDDVKLIARCGTTEAPVFVDDLRAWALREAWTRSKFYRKLAKSRRYGWIKQEGSVAYRTERGERLLKAWRVRGK